MTQQPPDITFQNGRYTILSQLGAGGIATVWGAFDNTLECERAMKVLAKQISTHPMMSMNSLDNTGIERFKQEAKLMSSLNHPNIVTVHDMFADQFNRYIVMEKCLGSLESWVQSNGVMPVSLVVHVTIEILKGLEYAHNKSIVHRDIKPHNILISEAGIVKVADFGLAHNGYASEAFTKTNALMGSVQFMSPEQRADAKRIDHRCDLYSVAMTMVWLLEKRTLGDLFIPDVIADLRERYSPDLVDILVKAGQRNPEQRFASAREMQEALERLTLLEPIDHKMLFGIELREVPLRELYDNEQLTSIRDRLQPSLTDNSKAQPSTSSADSTIRLLGIIVILLVTIIGFLIYQQAFSSNLDSTTTQTKQTAQTNTAIDQSPRQFEKCSTFIERTQHTLVLGPRESFSMSMGDFNNDGFTDAVFANLMDKSISLYQGNESTNLSDLTPIETDTIRIFTPPLFGDIDKDGLVDMVGLHQDNSRITIHKGLPNNTFRDLEVYGRDEMLQEPSPKKGILTDLDEDGWLDLLFLTRQQEGKSRLMWRRNAQKGLDFEILDLPGVMEEPLEWHKVLGTFEQDIHLDPSKPRIHWIEDGVLYQQDILKTGMLGLKTQVSQDVSNLSILQVLDSPEGILWLLKGPEKNIVMVKPNQAPCQLIDDLRTLRPLSDRGQVSFGYWNNDNKLDILTSTSCTYCTSNHILHIAQ